MGVLVTTSASGPLWVELLSCEEAGFHFSGLLAKKRQASNLAACLLATWAARCQIQGTRTHWVKARLVKRAMSPFMFVCVCVSVCVCVCVRACQLCEDPFHLVTRTESCAVECTRTRMASRGRSTRAGEARGGMGWGRGRLITRKPPS